MANRSDSTGVPEVDAVLDTFHPAVAAWVREQFDSPTEVQLRGWEAIGRGGNVLLGAPTGSGKTLAAFLSGIDQLFRAPEPAADERLRLLYLSPLRALNYDIERNLRGPLLGIRRHAARLGLEVPEIRVGVRTGDTPQSERQRQKRNPPDIFITTPESLYVMLTSGTRELFNHVQWTIVDEIHALANSKRGTHMAFTLERLDLRVQEAAEERGEADARGRRVQRIGLSATQRPIERIAAFLGGVDATGPREVTVIDTPGAKEHDLQVIVPVDDMTAVGSKIVATELSDLDTPTSNNDSYSIWGALHAELLDHVEEHTSTIVFVNSRRLAERLATSLNELAARRVLARHVDAQRARYEAEGIEWTDETEVEVPAEVRTPLMARAHHGSISRETRTEMEELLKAGQLPCIVATSSLELGIDMGAVDLVLLVESPRSVASGLQRIGRAGHNVGDVSRGRIYPKHRADLVEAAAVTRLMHRREIEPVHVPELCLDVLAQQVVATCAERAFTVDELLELAHGAWPWRDLSRDQFENLLSLLAGYFPVDELADIKARVVWDRETGEVRTRSDAAKVAITNAGTIPDRGLYGVFAVGGGGRVGELDEEMVHETRLGDVIVLGSTSWRVEEITRDRVNVSPQPGAIGKPPFWHGEGAGRTVELGRAVGELIRVVADASPGAANAEDPQLAALIDEQGEDAELMQAIEEGYLCDRRAARNLIAFVREQIAATGAAPDDRTVVIERFRDELGDWRVCILTPFGKPVHAPWAMAIEEHLAAEYGLEINALWSDNGIALRLPDIDELPPLEALLPDPDEVEDLVVRKLGGSALFASRFREVATRALVLPLSSFRKRSPLWLQRLRAADVLRVAQQQASFPMILETYRECMRDVFSMPELRTLLQQLQDRSMRVLEVETRTASPMAASLLFDYTAAFMYDTDGDNPSTERRVQALSLDQALLRELLGSGDLRDLLDLDAVGEVQAELQRSAEGRRAKSMDQLHDLMRSLGDLSAAELAARVEPPEGEEADALEGWLAELKLTKRAVTVRLGDEERWISIEDTGDYVAAFGVQAPRGVPGVFLDASDDPLGRLLGRRARTTTPFTTGELARRWGVAPSLLEPKLDRMRIADQLLRGGFLPGGREEEWCDPEVLRRLRRRTLAHLRREIEPADRSALARFLAGWHGLVNPPAGSAAATRDVIVQLEGVEASPLQWERDLVAPRMSSWRAQWLDELVKTGQVTWMGRGSKHNAIQVALFAADNVELLAPPREELPDDADCRVLVETMEARGAMFLRDVVSTTGIPHERTLGALWRLAAAGWTTNDSWSTLRAGAGTPAQLAKAAREADRAAGIAEAGGSMEEIANAYGSSRRSGLRTGRRAGRARLPRRGPNAGVPGGSGEVDVRFGGRWSLLPATRAHEDERVAAMSEALLDTFGIVTRHSVQARPVAGGFAAVYRALAVQEEIGHVRRGWFVEGLGGAQFALPEAVDRLRAVREPTGGTPPVLVLRANDPAQPYGAILAWPEHPNPRSGAPGGASAGTPSTPRRDASSYVVLRDGELLATASTGGKRLVVWDREAMPEIARALARLVEQRRVDRLAIEGIDDTGAVDPDTVLAFADTGFIRTPRGLRATPTTVAEVREQLRSSRRVRVGDVQLPTHGRLPTEPTP